MDILFKSDICIVSAVLAVILGVVGWNKYFLRSSYLGMSDEIVIYRRYSDQFMFSVSVIATIFIVALMSRNWQELGDYLEIRMRQAVASVSVTVMLLVISLFYCAAFFIIAKTASKCKKGFLKRKFSGKAPRV